PAPVRQQLKMTATGGTWHPLPRAVTLPVVVSSFSDVNTASNRPRALRGEVLAPGDDHHAKGLADLSFCARAVTERERSKSLSTHFLADQRVVIHLSLLETHEPDASPKRAEMALL